MSRESLEYYLSLAYSVTLDPDPEGGYIAHIKDLPGCFNQGETLEETMANIQEAEEISVEIQAAISFHLEGLQLEGLPIPEPTTICEYIEAA